MSRKVILIASADNFWGIGKGNQLLHTVPEDMRRFRELTTGNIVVYGRKTLESFPGGRPLRDRLNIVISSGYQSSMEGLLAARSPEEAMRLAEESDPQEKKDIYICGGASIYRQMLPFCTDAYITRFDTSTEGVEAFLPNLDEDGSWKKASWTDWKESIAGIRYAFVNYIRKN